MGAEARRRRATTTRLEAALPAAHPPLAADATRLGLLLVTSSGVYEKGELDAVGSTCGRVLLWLGSFCGGFPPDFSWVQCDGGAPPCTGSSSRSKESERIVIRAPHARRRAASQHALRRPHATCAALRAGRTTASAGAGGTREGPSRERAGPEGPLVGRRVSPHSLRPAREASRATHTTAGGARFSRK